MKACLPSLHIQRPQTSKGFFFYRQSSVSVFVEKKTNRTVEERWIFPNEHSMVLCVQKAMGKLMIVSHVHVTCDLFTVQKC